MVMFTLHTSALMKVWLSTVKVLQGKMLRSVVGWIGWAHANGKHSRPLITWDDTVSNVAKHHFQLDRRVVATELPSWQNVWLWYGPGGRTSKPARNNTQSASREYVYVRWFRFQGDFRVVLHQRFGIKLSCSMYACWRVKFSCRVCSQTLWTKLVKTSSKQRHVLNFMYFFSPICFSRRKCVVEDRFTRQRPGKTIFFRSQFLRARAQHVPQDRMCTCSKFSKHIFFNPIFFPAAIGIQWAAILGKANLRPTKQNWYIVKALTQPFAHARHRNIVTKNWHDLTCNMCCGTFELCMSDALGLGTWAQHAKCVLQDMLRTCWRKIMFHRFSFMTGTMGTCAPCFVPDIWCRCTYNRWCPPHTTWNS